MALYILALESSAKAASVAIINGDDLLCQLFQNCGKTHSRTLLPMIESALLYCELKMDDIDLLAVSHGPGSFTGLRIGIATVKGLCWGADKPCIGVSTLEAMAAQLRHVDAVICAVMDARRNQVYNALFRAESGRLERLTPDRAISIEELEAELCGLEGNKIFVGDGAGLCYNLLRDNVAGLSIAPPHLVFQSAWAVASLANQRAGEAGSADELRPVYLRLSQAERERLEKESSRSSGN